MFVFRFLMILESPSLHGESGELASKLITGIAGDTTWLKVISVYLRSPADPSST